MPPYGVQYGLIVQYGVLYGGLLHMVVHYSVLPNIHNLHIVVPIVVPIVAPIECISPYGSPYCTPDRRMCFHLVRIVGVLVHMVLRIVAQIDPCSPIKSVLQVE